MLVTGPCRAQSYLTTRGWRFAHPQVLTDMFIMDFLDWLHIGWRLRRQYLDPAKCLALGGMAITHTLLSQDLLGFGLSAADVDASNKQSYSGTTTTLLYFINCCMARAPGPGLCR